MSNKIINLISFSFCTPPPLSEKRNLSLSESLLTSATPLIVAGIEATNHSKYKTTFNQKGFSLVGALITGVISLIIIGSINDLVVRSIKSSSNAEKITHTLNDKQRIINWFNNDLICAQTLKDYPMTETEKTNGKTLYDRTVQPEIELKIKNPKGDVLETLSSASSSHLERIVIKQVEDENVLKFSFTKNLWIQKTPSMNENLKKQIKS